MRQATKWILLAPELYRAPGGIARVSRHYLQALAENREDRELSIVVLNDKQITETQLQSSKAAGVPAIGCGKSKLQCALALWRETKGKSVHVTCTHVALSPLLVLLSWFRPELTFDIVIHGIEIWKPLPRSQRSGLKQARLILSVSDFTRRDLVTRYPEFGGHCQVLPNALDPSFEISEADHAASTVPGRVLAVSRLAAHDWEKGIDHLIQALPLARHRRKDLHLHIVGDGVDRERLEEIAQDIEEPNCVTFLGRVDDDVLKSELAACELFALPSRKEGFGLVYLEAMAAGKPCIVANAGGAPEVVNENSGIVIPYGDVTLLAETMIATLNNNWDATQIRRRAKQFAFSAFVNRWRTLTTLTS